MKHNEQEITDTSEYYLNRKTRCTTTPTFRYVKPFIHGKTLDIGMGTGEYLELLPAGSIGLDVSEKNISIVKEKGLKAIRADINQGLPFPDHSFHTVFCSHVIEHVDSPLHLLREAHRIISYEGHIIFAVPLEKTVVRLFKERYFKDHTGHLYGFSVECMERLLEHAGFRCIEKYFNFPLLNRYRFFERCLQAASNNFWQYFCTMYWIVARKK